MKKISYILSAAAIAMAGLTSCTLDAINYTEKDTSNFPLTSEDADQALAGIYQNLNVPNATPQCSFYYVAQLAGDDALGGGGENDMLMQAEDLMMVSTDNMTQQFWIDRYAGINRANSLLDGINNISLAESQKNQIAGEAKFLRAFFYYELSSMYGNVPLVITSSAAQPVQPTAAELWGQILQDLYEAASTMPAQRLTNGHVDKYTASAMLARAWLYYTGMYCNGENLADLVSTNYSPLTSVTLPNGETLTKQQVITLVDEAVNNSGYSLVPDFRNLWAYTNRFTVEDFDYTKGQGLKWVEDDNAINPESMFAVKFNKQASWSTTIGYANGYALHFGVRGTAVFPFGAGWGAGPVAMNLVNDWKSAEPNDKRRDATIQDMSKLSGFALGGGGDYMQESGFYGMKLSPVEANAVKDDGTPYVSVCFENLMYPGGWDVAGAENMQLNNIHDMVLIRFADLLLMQSELKEDVTGINKVRERAGLPAINGYSLQALQNERRWELACEGIRWNDIRRWHIAATALAKQENQPTYYCGNPDTNKPHNGGYASRYNATAGFQKMPETQIALGTVQQNDGWADASSEYTGW